VLVSKQSIEAQTTTGNGEPSPVGDGRPRIEARFGRSAAGVMRPTFIVNTPIRDLGEYRRLAHVAARLKRHGHVEVNISTLAEKARHGVPAGGSPWHEYAAYNPTPAQFFPDAMIEPFLPEPFVRRNRELLLAKASILRELGLGAAFWSYEPNYLPEAFFVANPLMRGPRTDHPRRSRRVEFAPCMDLPESREMTSRMVAQLARHVPELGTYFFKTNDAGPGLCWSDWQYAGPNGPAACRHRPVGERVRGLVEAILQGGQRAGAELTVHLTGNFTPIELKSIEAELPPRSFCREVGRASISIASGADVCYPVRGVLDLIGVLQPLQRLRGARDNGSNGETVGELRAIFVDLRSHYDRGYERLETSEKIIETIDTFLARPAFGPIALLDHARELCDTWVGTERADVLFEAMYELHETLKYKRAALPHVSAIYGGVSLRYLTRPLLAVPRALSEQEEAYFLTHVFNVSRDRARGDYIDLHGTRLVPQWMHLDAADPRVWPIAMVRNNLRAVADKLDRLGDVDSGHWRQMSTALRLYANILRSCGNFFAVQIIRDRNAARFAAPPEPPAPQSSVSGHPDLALLNEIMRDELENAGETAALLRTADGMNVISHARHPEDEDTFLLGPDLLAQIERKQQLMRDHWQDAEAYFATPNK
jgi:hypothetical protein